MRRLGRQRLSRLSIACLSCDEYFRHIFLFNVNLFRFTQRIEVVRMQLRDERYIRTGKSGYSLKALFAHAWRMLFSSQIKILRSGALLGLSILSMIDLLGLKLLYPEAIQVQG
jgi:hypothetical protein